MKTCPSCGEEQPDWAVQCASCGAQLPPSRAEQAGPPGGWSAPPPPPGYAPPPPGYAPPPGYGYGPPAGYGYGAPPVVYAGWWYRVGATIIDGLIIGVIRTVIDGVSGAGAVTTHRAAGALAVASLVGLAVTLLYQGLLLAYRGQTVGMMAVGTRIADADTGGGIGVGRGVLRAVVMTVLAILVLPGLLDIFWPLWDRRNQTLHDKAVRTVILRSR